MSLKMWIISCARRRVETGVEGCIVALFVNINPSGGFFTDNGRWLQIAQRGKYLADTCLLDQNIGGGGAHAGKENTPHHQVCYNSVK